MTCRRFRLGPSATRWVLGASFALLGLLGGGGCGGKEAERADAPTGLSPEAGASVGADAAETQAPKVSPSELRWEAQTETTWIEVPTVESGADFARSFVPWRVALDPSGAPTVSKEEGELRVRGLSRGFSLESERFALGEPLVVAFVLTRDSAARLPWIETMGGEYRGRGRDDTFAFALERGDGSFVDDVFIGPVFIGGGRSGPMAVAPSMRVEHHLGVQHYVDLREPGKYTLHCLSLARSYTPEGWMAGMEAFVRAELTKRVGEEAAAGASWDADLQAITLPDGMRVTVTPSLSHELEASPIELPAALLARLDEGRRSVTDYARFSIEVVEASPAQREAMVPRWRARAEQATESAWPKPIGDGAAEAIAFAAQDDFVPAIEGWLRAGPTQWKGRRTQLLDGLALRGSEASIKLLLEFAEGDDWWALRYLRDEAVRTHAEALIELLAHEDGVARIVAFERLSQVAGDRFGASWEGYHHEHPSVDEGRALQAAARARF